MKKLLLLLILIPYTIFSQDLNEFEIEQFKISTPLDLTQIENYTYYITKLNNELDKTLSLKNRDDKREIVILEDLNSFNKYLELIEVPTRDDYVFLKYSDGRSKVVLYNNKIINFSSLAHHLTLQYIDFYGGETPNWFSIGISTYFEDFRPEEEFKQKNRWVNNLKNSNLDNIYTNTIKKSSNNTDPSMSWAIIHYLISTENRDHNRLFWDSLSLLRYRGNNNKIKEIETMYSSYNLNKNIKEFILNIKGYNDYMDLGIEAYQLDNFETAVDNFKNAILQEPFNYSPEYYLGLSYSKLNRYEEAYSHLSLSLEKGAPKDIVYYSIGVNFYNEKSFILAKKYLSRIEDKIYQVMSEKLLNEISKY